MARQSCLTLLVGPSGLLRESLIRILDPSNFRISLSAESVRDLVLKPLPKHRSLLLIIDVDGDGDSSELEKISEFKAIYPDSHVVILADRCQSGDVVAAFRAGANAYLTKHTAYDTFVKSLELVDLGQSVFPADALSLISCEKLNSEDKSKQETSEHDGNSLEVGAVELSMLSPREICVLGCLIEGKSNKIIARKFHIADATVKVHVKTILRKIRVRNRTQAAVWAMNNGLLATLSGHAWAGNQDMAHHPHDMLDPVVEEHTGRQFEDPHPL
ncbi:response regulator transcription factor [Mesorhizobium sp. WSM3859]|uniref:response regulator transcription factor n=1 Tax=Mesorhizobium sp. WSM3859 TaxID=2029402 RepID=UPI000BAF3230|nr:response regulator transcription factor [Mesorhizobium sp. WSM3859]PBC06798.1 helix-turn-helix transcriptional regulator [Mesorhizobium sp. WSM3859]